MPSVSIYRPPAARKLEQSAHGQGRDVVGTTPPDKSRLKCSEEPPKDGNQGSRRSENNGMSVFRNAITSIRVQNKVPRCNKNVESTNERHKTELSISRQEEIGKSTVQNRQRKPDIQIRIEVNESKQEEVVKSSVQSRQRKPDIQVYVPKGRRVANITSNNNDGKVTPSAGSDEKSYKVPEVENDISTRNGCCETTAKSTRNSFPVVGNDVVSQNGCSEASSTTVKSNRSSQFVSRSDVVVENGSAEGTSQGTKSCRVSLPEAGVIENDVTTQNGCFESSDRSSTSIENDVSVQNGSSESLDTPAKSFESVVPSERCSISTTAVENDVRVQNGCTEASETPAKSKSFVSEAVEDEVTNGCSATAASCASTATVPTKISEPEVVIIDDETSPNGVDKTLNVVKKSEPKCTIPEVTQKESPSPSGKVISSSQTSSKSVISDNSNSNTEKVSSHDHADKSGVHLNPEECDWESMFDDTGECLDPSLLEQLTNAVGEVTIEKPRSSYNDFKTKSLDMVADEFPHVIEIYNFPPEFQLQDLMTVFSQFKNSGFEIKWVDDTHALGIFSSSAVVSEVLATYHPFVKTRSLKEGTPLSKMKARRSAEFLQPYKPRPDTCPALARRLVTGALGVRLPTSREEREAEKKLLRKAREKKKLEAKQKEDAWEGTFS